MYHRVGRGEATYLEVGKYLMKLLGKDKAGWWFRIYLTGLGDRGKQDAPTVSANLEKVFRELGFIEKESTFDLRNELSNFGNGWGHHWNDRWKQIYQNIETVGKF
jgi:hypothetical protein